MLKRGKKVIGRPKTVICQCYYNPKGELEINPMCNEHNKDLETEHDLVEWTTEKGYGEECTKCGFKYTKKMEGEVNIITPRFYESEEYKKCKQEHGDI